MNQDSENREVMETDGEAPSEHPTPNRFEEEGRRAEEAGRRLKRRILIVMVAMVVFAVVAIPLMTLLDRALGEKEDPEQPYTPPQRPTGVLWATPDYDRLIDIRKDPDYLALDRDVRLSHGEVTKTLEPSKMSSYSPAVKVLYDLVQALIDGDADAYNALFSERYAMDVGMPDLEAPFTMQRVYNIVITEVEERTVSTAADGKYTEYLYKLEYMINRNDGTYRVDIGHDASRPQYFMLTDREGEVLIDALRYFE